MASSLLLLLLFLGFWLQKVYEDEYQALKKETDFMFINSVRGIEGEIMHDLILDPIHIVLTDSTPLTHFQFIGKEKFEAGHKEVTKSIQKSVKGMKKMLRTDSTIQVSVQSHILPDSLEVGTPSGTFGSLSLYLALSEKDTLLSDSDFNSSKDSMVFALLENRFEKTFDDSQLPFSYKIVTHKHTDTCARLEFISESYTDISSGENYAVAFSDYKAFLLKGMIPQILFSILLFGCVALSFFLIYQSLQRQRRLTALKNDFISNVTHELKTPITTVGVAIEAMSNFNALKDPSKTQEYLNISKHELNRLSILVDKVLKMSQFEKTEPELKIETLDLKELIQEILNSMKLQFEKFAAQVSFDFTGNHFFIEGDKIHLTSVIYNLLDNALKYSPSQPEISVALANSEDQISMSVKDQGIGISQEFKAKIFDKFFRVPTGDAHNVKGHGLGLSYVASVVEQHHGTIEVESEQGKGSVFRVFLPKKEL